MNILTDFVRSIFCIKIHIITKVVIQTYVNTKYLLNEDMDLISKGCLFLSCNRTRENETCNVVFDHN